MALYLGSSQKLKVNIVENVVGDDSGEKTYLYNGVELPALPKWNRTAYPYVVIYKCIYDDYYTMRASSNPCYVTYSYIMFGIGHNNLYWDERNMFLEFRDFVQQDGEFSPGIQNLDDVNFLWTNIAICYADNYTSLYDGMDGTALDEPDPLAGTIYLEAGVLEEVLSTTQISTSWHMRYPMPIKQPTAYSYKGVVLPKLPEVEGYDYVFIDHDADSTYVIISTVPLYVNGEKSDSRWWFWNLSDAGSAMRWGVGSVDPWYCDNKRTNYAKDKEVYSTDATVLWTNYAIYDNNGKLLMEKSPDPTPVYE